MEKDWKLFRKKLGSWQDVSRSNMFIILLGLLRDEAITMDDLDEFSDELKEDIAQFMK